MSHLASKDRGGRCLRVNSMQKAQSSICSYLSPACTTICPVWLDCMGISVKDRRRLYSGYDEESLKSSGQENDKIRSDSVL